MSKTQLWPVILFVALTSCQKESRQVNLEAPKCVDPKDPKCNKNSTEEQNSGKKNDEEVDPFGDKKESPPSSSGPETPAGGGPTVGGPAPDTSSVDTGVPDSDKPEQTGDTGGVGGFPGGDGGIPGSDGGAPVPGQPLPDSPGNDNEALPKDTSLGIGASLDDKGQAVMEFPTELKGKLKELKSTVGCSFAPSKEANIAGTITAKIRIEFQLEDKSCIGEAFAPIGGKDKVQIATKCETKAAILPLK